MHVSRGSRFLGTDDGTLLLCSMRPVFPQLRRQKLPWTAKEEEVLKVLFLLLRLQKDQYYRSSLFCMSCHKIILHCRLEGIACETLMFLLVNFHFMTDHHVM